MDRTTLHAGMEQPAADAEVAAGLLRVTGWVFDVGGPLDTAVLVADAGPGAPVRLGGAREDVAAAFPDVPHAVAAGFEGSVDLRAADGPVRIALLVRRADGFWEEAAALTVRVRAPERPLDGARPRAAFTIVQDEPVFLPLWLDYYGRSFAPEDLYVLAHGGGVDAGGRANVVPVHREASFDHHWLKATVERFQAFLLSSYDTVLFAEVDELVVADPLRYAGLDAYLDAFTGPAVRCTGFNVVHQPDEPALRWDEPLLAQRGFWHASEQYSKRLVSRIPLRWSDGFHRELAAPDDPPDPELLLVHLHRVDYDFCLARHRRSAARDWNAADEEGGAGFQNRIVEEEAFAAWFRAGPDLDAPRERIPDHLRSVV